MRASCGVLSKIWSQSKIEGSNITPAPNSSKNFACQNSIHPSISTRKINYFGTSNKSQKYAQLRANPQVALAIGNIQIKATATDCGNPSANPDYQKIYNAKFPHLGGLYPPTEEDVVIRCEPSEIVVYKFTGEASWEVLDPVQHTAYRRG